MAFIFPLVGAAVSAMGTIAAGNAAQQAAQAQAQALNFRAKQEDMAAAEARAAAQRQAIEKRQQGILAQSQLQARAAASGGSATDAGILALEKEVVGQREYLALTETYKGENRARGLEDQATISRMSAQAALAEGEARKQASMFSAFGTLIGGAGSAFSAYKGLPMASATPGNPLSLDPYLYNGSRL